MKAFIKNMLSGSTDVSHKRVIAVCAFIVLVIMVIAHFFGAAVNDSSIFTFGGLCGGESVLTIAERFTKKDTNP